MSNSVAIAQALAVAVKAYRAKHPKFVFDKDTSTVYMRLLADLPGAAVMGAVLDHISKSPWFPGVDEIRAKAAEIMTNGSAQLTPYEAWAEVLKVFSSIGPREHENQLVEKTVQSMGGWLVLGASTNQIADRARFVESYNIFITREKNTLVTLPVVRELTAAMSDPEQLGSAEVKQLVAQFTR